MSKSPDRSVGASPEWSRRWWRDAMRELRELHGCLSTVMLRVLTATAVVSVALLVASCGAAGQEGARTSGVAAPGAPSAVVPDVVGLRAGEAVKALAAAGFVTNIRFQTDRPRTGEVLRSAPTAGAESAEGAVVVLEVSLPPRLPVSDADHEHDLHPFSSVVERNPDAFVGVYLDEAGIAHAVFGPGVDTAAWDQRLRAAAGGVTYKTDECFRNRHDLRMIQDEITANQDWTDNDHLAFGVGIDPASCTVRVESDLLDPAEVASLVARYGTSLSFDTTKGSHPVLLPLTHS